MRFAKKTLLISIITLALASCNLIPGTLQGGSEEADPGQVDPADAQQVAPAQQQAAVMEILISANRIRLAQGQRPLVANSQLMQAAEARAVEMAELGYFDHVHPMRGTAEIERLLRPEFPEARLAELLFLDDCTVSELAEFATGAWAADEANRETLLDPSFNLIGAGAELGPGGWYTVLVLSE